MNPTPTAGALRAAELIAVSTTDAILDGCVPYAQVERLAALIDRETAEPELIGALRSIQRLALSSAGQDCEIARLCAGALDRAARGQ